MKTKDMPSVRARQTSNQALRVLRVVSYASANVKNEIERAYMAGYRHGRKMKEPTDGK